MQCERLNKKNHRIRTKIEPASSDNRWAALSVKLQNSYLRCEDQDNRVIITEIKYSKRKIAAIIVGRSVS
jgi:hypothetical protein